MVALLGRIWLYHPFMLKLARKIPHILEEFMDQVDEYVNVKDILRVLVSSHQEGKRSERNGGSVDKKSESSRQGRRPERQQDRNP